VLVIQQSSFNVHPPTKRDFIKQVSIMNPYDEIISSYHRPVHGIQQASTNERKPVSGSEVKYNCNIDYYSCLPENQRKIIFPYTHSNND